MIASTMAIICLIDYAVSNACDPKLSGMTFYSPYVYYIPNSGYLSWKLTHTVATGDSCNCGTIEYEWYKTAGTSGQGDLYGHIYYHFESYCTKTENYNTIFPHPYANG
jgi:hypothetical protein